MSRSIPNIRTPRVLSIPEFTLESGIVLHDLQQTYYLDGALDEAQANVVLIFHALTGNADAAGDWWAPSIGDGAAVDTRQVAVLSPNLLGSCYGTSGPTTHPEFPAVTPRDQARFAHLLVASLGISRLRLVTGGSLGGMVALEYAALYGETVDATAVFAAPAAHTAHAIAWNAVQRACLDQLPGDAGVALARQLAMISFRSEREFEARFGRTTESDGRFSVASYLAHHGDKLVQRFDAATYRTLIDTMDAHDLGRGRGGVLRALSALPTPLFAVGIAGDQLYSADVVRRWARQAGAQYRELRSVLGHDAFLLEHEQVGAVLREALAAGVAARQSKADGAQVA